MFTTYQMYKYICFILLHCLYFLEIIPKFCVQDKKQKGLFY